MLYKHLFYNLAFKSLNIFVYFSVLKYNSRVTVRNKKKLLLVHTLGIIGLTVVGEGKEWNAPS